MAVIFDSEVLKERARNLGTRNGLRRVFVTLAPTGAPTHALLDLEFHNASHLSPLPPPAQFTIAGGVRIRAGTAPGEVKVEQVLAGSASNVLRLRVAPIGDYSAYTLSLPPGNFDPLFAAIGFKFRPGCFNLNCAPDWASAEAPPAEPVIDYLARDYDSFRHLLMAAMAERVPGWQPTSEADLDQVLIDLIAADADELADYQDRVMNEAYLGSARKRVSLARHARLMDYHVHQGNQASTWIAVHVNVPAFTVPRDAGVWTGERWNDPAVVIFAFDRDQLCRQALNRLLPYRWGGTVTALNRGSTEVDLTTPAPLASPGEADTLRDLLLAADVDHLLIEEELNPETGTVNGRDVRARQVLRLAPRDAVPPRAESILDPVEGRWCVRVRWLAEDALTRTYCFVTRCPGHPPVEGVTVFCGNLAAASHGRPHVTTFRTPGTPLAGLDLSSFVGTDEAHTEAGHWGIVARLTQTPLAYRPTLPGGERPPVSTLGVTVDGAPWQERSDLIESEGDDEHFIVETDERQRSLLRFGDGVNGAPLPPNAAVQCRYRVGQGTAGNVGADTLTGFAPAALAGVERLWNPLDVGNGLEPEPAAEVLRRAPEAYRARQRRAVTLQDYADRAEEVPGVSRARARYAWTGSWRTVRVVIDPHGGTTLEAALIERVSAALEAVRLIGEDLEIRPAAYVALDIRMRVCAHPRYWPEHLRIALESEFSDGWTPDGRRGFFHPDLWTFGQPLYASRLIGRALEVQGVERVLSLSMRRWNPGAGGGLTTVTLGPDDLPDALVEKLEAGAFEIIRVENDPDRLEAGRIAFEILGGRR
jgi:hypothetical protein